MGQGCWRRLVPCALALTLPGVLSSETEDSRNDGAVVDGSFCAHIADLPTAPQPAWALPDTTMCFVDVPPPTVLDLALARGNYPRTVFEVDQRLVSPELPARARVDELWLESVDRWWLRDEYYEQRYRGIPIDGNTFVLRDSGTGLRFMRHFIAHLEVDIVARLTESRARRFAQQHLHSAGSARKLRGRAKRLIATHAACTNCTPALRLVWRFYDREPPETKYCHWSIDVDALTGLTTSRNEHCCCIE